ncbi:tetratricopeptide repeat protein [Alloacidobacterium sp.]|uniref:tetratricopeptide repeat protein n=1 Tax=Alloacidobacterium sp. TaxID=2951999 RepID=UPI002D4C4B7D|nr:tetratricopeptide repeat protein [Alloacidobacterium sp.]HYK35689.1 tetratricopeptide repeat protein [Alloacidobacterium sp.]
MALIKARTEAASGLLPPLCREIIKRMDKIAALTEILTLDPTNAFARYGLAMEYASQGSVETSLQEFQRLLSDHPDYTAGYFMAAQTLAKAGRTDEAKAKLTQGIASAQRTGNQHALSEMQAMLDDLDLAG